MHFDSYLEAFLCLVTHCKPPLVSNFTLHSYLISVVCFVYVFVPIVTPKPASPNCMSVMTLHDQWVDYSLGDPLAPPMPVQSSHACMPQCCLSSWFCGFNLTHNMSSITSGGNLVFIVLQGFRSLFCHECLRFWKFFINVINNWYGCIFLFLCRFLE